MRRATKNQGDRPSATTRVWKRKDRGERDAMSPSIRELVLGWGDAGSNRAYAEVYVPRPNRAT